jgi:Zn finger protein HypA/HybF involved in hydrogenase expression
MLTITCQDCGNQVQIPRADVEAAGVLQCNCGSQNLDIRDPSGKQLVHTGQQPAAAAQAPVAQAPPMAPQGLIYTITCRACGNQVELEAEKYHAAGEVKCPCGSSDLKVEQPPPSTAELMMAVRQLNTVCKLCGNTDHPGWLELDDGRLFPCRACGGT